MASAIQPINMLTPSSHLLSVSTLALIPCRRLKTETTHILYIHPFKAYNSVTFSIFRVVCPSLQSVLDFCLDLAKPLAQGPYVVPPLSLPINSFVHCILAPASASALA